MRANFGAFETAFNNLDAGLSQVEVSGRRPLSPEELQVLQSAAANFSTAVQRGLSIGTFAIGAGLGLGIGYLIWGR